MKRIKDSMLVGMLSGLLGVICMDLSSLLLWRNKKLEGLHGHIAGSMIMNTFKLNKGKNFLIGQLFHMSVGSAIGVGMVEILKKYGKDHYILKGGFLSVTVWSILYNFGQRMGFYKMNPRLIRSSYSAILNHLIFGLTTTQAIVALADPIIFQKRSYLSNQETKPEKSLVQPIFPVVNVSDEKGTTVISNT